jgi:hypothetical protein
MCLIGNWLLMVAMLAPPSVNDLTPLEKQTANFYWAIGTDVRVSWSVEPKLCTVGQDMTVTLRIAGSVNPAEIRAPELVMLNLDPRDFQSLDETIPRTESTTGVEFRYRLRAKLGGEFNLPELAFAYYHPNRAEGKRFVTTYAESVTFRVEAEVQIPTPSTPKKTLPAKLAGSFVAGGSLFLLSWLVSLLLVFPGFWLTNKLVKRWKPDEATRLAKKRMIMIRHAEASLRVAAKSTDPVLAIEEVLFRFPTTETHQDKVAELLRRCQEARFSGQADASGPLLVQDTMLLLQDLKGTA